MLDSPTPTANTFKAALSRYRGSEAQRLRAPIPDHFEVPFRTFHNGLRVLLNLDADDLLAVGIIADMGEFRAFEKNPFLWMIKAPDTSAEDLWLLINRRQPALLKALEPLLQAAE